MPGGLREMANTARKAPLLETARNARHLAIGASSEPLGGRVTESPLRARVWLTAGSAPAQVARNQASA